ncbi:hypothetical protein L249_0337 [Ophiocordyceps polyrhachis-furcata BCC 54312]|uniref:Uncharacterized protein n=1 Tax=Ophiocordyceps polyrhachis-furcata BCC 54312 TaxID=1330021 RepID=A0A367LEA4_9HYPO|nr:hypothetical protein L249_0337 [Ophiocordyceps polyrhachis-furcata BCC 54312]
MRHTMLREGRNRQKAPPTAHISHNPHFIPQAMAARNTIQAISIWGCCILGLGTTAIIATIGFLYLFWTESETAATNSRPPSALWNAIVFSGWAARAITISSILIRLVIGLQSGLMTAMLASIVIEKRGVHLAQLPALSIMRCISSGAQNLYEPLASGPRNLETLCYGVIAVLAVAVSMASNFTSTLLLADFGAVNVQAATKVDSVPIGINSTHTTTGIDHWRSQPNSFPRFAELAADPIPVPGIQDTGPSLRAFLPYQTAADRESVKTFDGPAPVLDFRVVCLRPQLHNLAVSYSLHMTSTSMYITGWFAGFDPAYNIKSPASTTGDFNCTMVQTFGATNDYNVKSLCFTQLQGPDDDGTSSHRSLIFSMDDSEYLEPWSFKHFVHSTDGAWSAWTSRDKTQTLRATACRNLADEPQVRHVNMMATEPHKEPSTEFHAESGKVKTGDIISLYCRQCSPSAPRTGRMGLKLLSGSYDLGKLVYIPVYESLGKGLYQDLPWNPVAPMSNSGNSINEVFIDVFWDIIDQTGNAAFAVQTLFTILSQISYYNSLTRFTIHLDGQRKSWEEHVVPTRRGGLAGVMTIISAHLLLLLLVSVLFMRTTCSSFLFNSWPAVMQLYCALPLEDGTKKRPDMTDKEVKKQLESQGLQNTTYWISQSCKMKV